MHYKTIKFNIKIPQTKHTQFSFFAARFARKVRYRDFAREARRNFLPPQSEKWIDAAACPP